MVDMIGGAGGEEEKEVAKAHSDFTMWGSRENSSIKSTRGLAELFCC